MPCKILGSSRILELSYDNAILTIYAVYGTPSKVQIYVINVRIYYFKQTYGMNYTVYTSSSLHPPITTGVVLKLLRIASCKLVIAA